jgi:soluble lytic murein transglycosylase-like protein
MISGISEGGIQAAESRIQQIESMLRTVRAQANPVPPAGLPTTDSAESPRPFQFYLQKTKAATSLEQKAKAFQPAVESLSERYGVDKALINAVIRQESGFNPNAVSRAGAVGLMQLMPATAQSLGVTNPKDPSQNLEGGVRYLKSMLDRFNGNIPLALAAYNAGAGAVQKYKGIPPYEETRNYVRNILSLYLKSKQENTSQA